MKFLDFFKPKQGKTYNEALDGIRLGKQLVSVYDIMKDGSWYTLKELAIRTGHPEASVSSRIRDLRKSSYGSHKVESKRLTKATWVYRINND